MQFSIKEHVQGPKLMTLVENLNNLKLHYPLHGSKDKNLQSRSLKLGLTMGQAEM